MRVFCSLEISRMSVVWRRGTLVTNSNEPGFVVTDMSEEDDHLVVRWQHSGVKGINSSDLGSIRRFSEAEEEQARRAAGRSSLQSLEALESLDRIEIAVEERSKTIRNERERHKVDGLIRRAFADPSECEWDKH